MNLGHTTQLRSGYWSSDRRANVQTGTSLLPEADARDAGLRLSATYDSRDAATYARHGIAAGVEYFKTSDSLGADREWERIEAGVRTALPIGKNVMWLSVAGGADLDDELPRDRAFSLGGPRTLPAYQHDELRRARLLAGAR